MCYHHNVFRIFINSVIDFIGARLKENQHNKDGELTSPIKEISMNIEDFIEKLYILVPVFLTALLSFFVWLRQTKKTSFDLNIRKSLDTVISPVYHELRRIRRIANPQKYEEQIRDFFNFYSSKNTKISNMGNVFLLQWYYDIEDLFIKFQCKRDEESWKLFCYKFDSFYTMVESEYYENSSILYKEYIWLKNLNKSNLFLRVIKEQIKVLYDFILFLMICLAFFYYLFFYAKLTNRIDIAFIYPYMELLYMVTILIIILFSLLLIINNGYISAVLLQKKRGKFSKYIDKKLPTFSYWWSEFPRFKYSNYREYPKKYDKRVL